MAEQVVVMYAGRIVEQGAAAEVLRHPPASLHAGADRLRTECPVRGISGCTQFPARCRIWPPPTGGLRLCRALRAGDGALPGEQYPPLLGDRQRAACFYSEFAEVARMSERYVIEVDTDLKKIFSGLRDGLFGQQTGELRAVDGVSFNIRPGTIFRLVGESGSG